MIAVLGHRGPDDHGVWIDENARSALAHSRLSIMDLSPAGHQPMRSANGRFVLTFNGEIYNFAELRRELEGRGRAPAGGWRSNSDTEVLLEAISSWGVETALAKSSGMFAFALWDRRERRLTLVRDRFGEKPLYYGWLGTIFAFGSELKALRTHPKFDNPISRQALTLFLARSYIPAPLAIFERIYKLPPGCLIELTLDGAMTPRSGPPEEGVSADGVRLKRYWSYKDAVESGLSSPFTDEHEALEELERALRTSVRRQSVADVPVGAFLSGGIDSSLIVAMQRHSSTAVRSYSIGFSEAAYNEAPEAMETAAYLGTTHRDQYVTAQEARDVIEDLPSIFDEPFADASQIPTYILSCLAAREVKVALTGDGADELFAGYYHHFLAPSVWRQLNALPSVARRAITAALSRVPPQAWEQAAGLFAKRKQSHIGFKVQKALRAAVRSSSLDDVHDALREEWNLNSFPLLDPVPNYVSIDLALGSMASDADQIMYRDAITYLPGDILCKVDRSSMAASLETRAPFLDHHVAEVAARIPLRMKVRHGRGKLILRDLLRRYLPSHLVERPKNGFAAPIGDWLKGPLRPWAEDVLETSTMCREGWLDADLVSRHWQNHLSGKEDSSGALWGVLMFNSWLRHSPQLSRRSELPRALELRPSPTTTIDLRSTEQCLLV